MNMPQRSRISTTHEAFLPTSHVAFGAALALVWFMASAVLAVGMTTGQRESFTFLIALVLTGVSSAIPNLIAFAFHPSTAVGMAGVVALETLMGFGVGWLGHYLWQRGTWTRWIIPVLLGLNSLAIGGVIFRPLFAR
jgi:hypothetical protein